MLTSKEYIFLFLTILLSLTVYHLLENISSFYATDDSTLLIIDAVFIVVILSCFGLALFLTRPKK
jgi:hypothetical protein